MVPNFIGIPTVLGQPANAYARLQQPVQPCFGFGIGVAPADEALYRQSIEQQLCEYEAYRQFRCYSPPILVRKHVQSREVTPMAEARKLINGAVEGVREAGRLAK